MNIVHRLYRLAILVALLLVGTHSILAKGPPDKVTINGPGLKDEIEVIDREVLSGLDIVALVDSDRPIEAPNVDEGYELAYYYQDRAGLFRRAWSLRYYPNPSGDLGYIYNSHAHNGPWRYAKPKGDAAMQRLLEEHGALSNSWLALPNTAGTSLSVAWLIMSAIALALIGGLVQRRKLSWPK
jgi:hypothetical protein